jgi:Rieske Fe-S protein
LRVLHDGRPVEVRRVGEEVVARSLICTHFACEVRWRPDEEVYACPCHDGRFGPDGRVLGGPPSRPLPEVPVRVAGGLVVLGG